MASLTERRQKRRRKTTTPRDIVGEWASKTKNPSFAARRRLDLPGKQRLDERRPLPRARAPPAFTRARCVSAALVCREKPRNLRAVWLVARSVEERHMVHRGWASTRGISVRVHTHIPDALSSQRAIVTLETDKSNARARPRNCSVQNPEFFSFARDGKKLEQRDHLPRRC